MFCDLHFIFKTHRRAQVLLIVYIHRPSAHDSRLKFQLTPHTPPPTPANQGCWEGKGFKDDLKEYTAWVDSLSSEATYKSLIDANAAADLADML